jgi:hypothetical protein
MKPTDRKLLDRVRDALCLKHHSIRTVQRVITAEMAIGDPVFHP